MAPGYGVVGMVLLGHSLDSEVIPEVFSSPTDSMGNTSAHLSSGITSWRKWRPTWRIIFLSSWMHFLKEQEGYKAHVKQIWSGCRASGWEKDFQLLKIPVGFLPLKVFLSVAKVINFVQKWWKNQNSHSQTLHLREEWNASNFGKKNKNKRKIQFTGIIAKLLHVVPFLMCSNICEQEVYNVLFLFSVLDLFPTEFCILII